MGVLTDFFIGDDETARTVDEVLPPGHPDRVDLKGLMQTEMAQLQCILTDSEWDVKICDEYEMSATGDSTSNFPCSSSERSFFGALMG